jgi:hypothetical protein
MYFQRSIVRFAGASMLIGLMGIGFVQMAWADTYEVTTPVTFTVPENNTSTLQIVCTHSGSSSTSWDNYTNSPTISGTFTADLHLSVDSSNWNVTVLGLTFDAQSPGALVYSNYTRRIESVATMNMMNVHANLYSATEIAVNNNHFDETDATLLLNGGIISWNRSAGTRQLSADPLTLPLVGAGSGNDGTISVNDFTGAPTLTQDGYSTYDVEMWVNLNSSLSEPILTVKYLTTTYTGMLRSDGYISAALGSFVLETPDGGGRGQQFQMLQAMNQVSAPEPSTLVMLSGMAAILTGYGWWRRRSRTRAIR